MEFLASQARTISALTKSFWGQAPLASTFHLILRERTIDGQALTASCGLVFALILPRAEVVFLLQRSVQTEKTIRCCAHAGARFSTTRFSPLEKLQRAFSN